jgi:3-oxoacyl-[acyl-carrier protein] reductase
VIAQLPELRPTYPDLAGKIAVVTGGSRGIGAVTALALAANGARVVVSGREEPDVERVAGAVEDAGADVLGVTADVRRWEDVVRLRDATHERFGPADVLVPFAGGFGAYTPLQDIGEDEWHEVIDANLTGTFLCLKAFVPAMIERRSGAVVTMASNAARHLDATLTASYAAAKAGIVQLTRHAALELGPHGIRVNCIAPATTTTERIERILTEPRRAELAAKSALGRLGRPEECAMATLFLASDAAASFLTGVTLDISGGRIML